MSSDSVNGFAKVPLHIDIVSDVVCPWCVIGYRRLQQALAKYADSIEAEIDWYPFELNPQMPAEGENLREHLRRKYGTTPSESASARERLTALGAAVGFTFDFSDDMRIVNTFRAHQLLHWARNFDRQNALSLRLFGDYFSARKDINVPEVLLDAADAAGLPREEAREVLESQVYAEEVRSLEEHVLGQGIQGVPLFIFNYSSALSGAQDTTTFEQVLQRFAEQHKAQ